VMPRGRAIRNNLTIWEDSPLPKLPPLYGAIFVRDGEDRTAIEELADHLRDEIHLEPKWRTPVAPSGRVPAKPVS